MGGCWKKRWLSISSLGSCHPTLLMLNSKCKYVSARAPWFNIIKYQNEMLNNISWVFQNGARSLIWHHNWSTKGIFYCWPIICIPLLIMWILACKMCGMLPHLIGTFSPNTLSSTERLRIGIQSPLLSPSPILIWWLKILFDGILAQPVFSLSSLLNACSLILIWAVLQCSLAFYGQKMQNFHLVNDPQKH